MAAPRNVGRYELHGEIAAGGTATVHIGRLRGDAGFSRTVAIKRLHAALAHDPDFAAMLVDEGRLSARIRHPNVVAVLDVVAMPGELLLVMDLVDGDSLSRLVREDGEASGKVRVPPPVAAAILVDALHGLHAAHEAKDEQGRSLGIVHRDMSPQNVLVGRDGIARIVDFGIAKAVTRSQITREGVLKGKYAYMAPEQLAGLVLGTGLGTELGTGLGGERGLMDVDRRTDIYAAGIVLWESLVGTRLFEADDEGTLLGKVAAARITPPGLLAPEATVLEAVTMKALARDPDQRFATAAEMADAIERALPPARRAEVAAWVEARAATVLDARAELVSAAEKGRARHATDEVITLAEAPPQKSSSKRAHAWWLLLLVIPLLGTIPFVLRGYRMERIERGERVDGPSVATSASSSADPASGTGATSSVPVIPSPALAPSFVPSAKPRPIPTTSPKTSASSKPSAPPKSTAGCEPPWTIDAQGKKIFRVECL